MQKKATDLFRDGETDKEFRDAMKKVTKEAGFEEYDENAKNVGVDDERKEKLLSQLKENREELHRSSVEDKAAGGMKTVEDVETFAELGCDRLGTSSAIRLLKEAGKI